MAGEGLPCASGGETRSRRSWRMLGRNLVVLQFLIDGYKRSSRIRASAVVKRQCTVTR
jgi:hypothetical protein